jgi:chromosome segregation ATPase
MAGVKAADEIAEAKSVLTQAERETERLDEAWEEALPGHASAIRREAEKLRQETLKVREEAKTLAKAEAGTVARLERLERELQRGARLGKVAPALAETDAERFEQLEAQVADLPAGEREEEQELRRRGAGVAEEVRSLFLRPKSPFMNAIAMRF